MAEMSWYLNMLGSVIVLIALVLAWPHWGAGDGPGGERVATGIAWHVEASANVFVGVRPLAGGDFCWRDPKLARTMNDASRPIRRCTTPRMACNQAERGNIKDKIHKG